MTFPLNDEAQSIIDRHEAQDSERAHANKARITRRHELKAEQNELLRELHALENHHYVPRKTATSGPPQDGKAKARIGAIKQKLARLDKKMQTLEAEKPQPILTAPRILALLDQHSDTELIPVDRPVPSLTKGERSLLDALPRLRDNVAALQTERKAIENAPLRASDAKKIARDAVTRLASRGIPKVMGIFKGGEIAWPRVASASTGGRHPSQTIDGAALVAFLLSDMLAEKLEELIDFNAGAFENPLSASDRTKQLRDLDAKISAAERVEAAAVEALVAEGHLVGHRADINVLAVLSYAIK
jgi:hypothetical protein